MAEPQHDFVAGETLRIRVGSYRRQGDTSVARLMRGQSFVAKNEDLKRSDAHIIFERPTEEELDVLEGGSAVVEDDERFVNFNYASPEYDPLLTLLQELNARDAKRFLSHDAWQPDSLGLARDAEEAGKNRDSIIAYIDGRIEQMNDEEGPV